MLVRKTIIQAQVLKLLQLWKYTKFDDVRNICIFVWQHEVGGDTLSNFESPSHKWQSGHRTVAIILPWSNTSNHSWRLVSLRFKMIFSEHVFISFLKLNSNVFRTALFQLHFQLQLHFERRKNRLFFFVSLTSTKLLHFNCFLTVLFGISC